MRRLILGIIVLSAGASALLWGQAAPALQFLITSDAHFGITRGSFRGQEHVDAAVVNAALVQRMNGMPKATFPADGGLRASLAIGPIDFVANTGDIANRQELKDHIQGAAKSWDQFRTIYIQGLTLLNRTGGKTPLFVVPGNHDVSDSIGHYNPMAPLTDSTAMAEMYNMMVSPATPKTAKTYDYSSDRILTSRDFAGIHFAFLTIWPDSVTRKWLEADLQRVAPTTPVILFVHDPPDPDSRHFTNPLNNHSINDHDKFENLLGDMFADGQANDAAPVVEQRAFEGFLRQHPNITAYFHGHNNWTQFYDWTGPGHSVVLHTFRVDSPMKGHFSGTDETRLAFDIATIDGTSRTMTVREVLWNADPQHPSGPIVWGASTTVALAPRSSSVAGGL